MDQSVQWAKPYKRSEFNNFNNLAVNNFLQVRLVSQGFEGGVVICSSVAREHLPNPIGLCVNYEHNSSDVLVDLALKFLCERLFDRLFELFAEHARRDSYGVLKFYQLVHM